MYVTRIRYTYECNDEKVAYRYAKEIWLIFAISKSQKAYIHNNQILEETVSPALQV